MDVIIPAPVVIRIYYFVIVPRKYIMFFHNVMLVFVTANDQCNLYRAPRVNKCNVMLDEVAREAGITDVFRQKTGHLKVALWYV